MSMTLDTSLFSRALRQKARRSKQTIPQILNRAGGSVAANAINLTPAAVRTDIVANLTSGGKAFRLLQSPKYQHRLPKKFQGYTRGTHTRAQINAAVRSFVKSKAFSRNYIKAGWFVALKVFRPGSKRRYSEKGHAGEGKGKKATVLSAFASLENHSTGSAKVGFAALQEAVNKEAKFMLTYGTTAIRKALK